ncbi:MAG: hypothetical protein ABEI74_03880 [Candidatus Pacearchaeota archaeon]
MTKSRGFKGKNRYIMAFLIGTALFVLVFVASYYISYGELYKASAFQDQAAYSFLEKRLGYTFFNKSICDEEKFEEMGEDLAFSGQRIAALEERLGENHEAVLERKKIYSLLQLEHFRFLEIYSKKCNKETNSILFFYTNEEKDSLINTQTESDLAGRVLSKINQERDDLYVYSFDVNLNTSLMEDLRQKYDVRREEAPVAIVNEEEEILNFEREIIENSLN